VYRCPPPVQGVLHALHDRSDGGLVTTLLEMAFAGNCGISVDLNDAAAVDAIEALFSEELGFVLEVPQPYRPCGPAALASCGLRCRRARESAL
jgi:phosphoribosylformylglycinamidine synthase